MPPQCSRAAGGTLMQCESLLHPLNLQQRSPELANVISRSLPTHTHTHTHAHKKTTHTSMHTHIYTHTRLHTSLHYDFKHRPIDSMPHLFPTIFGHHTWASVHRQERDRSRSRQRGGRDEARGGRHDRPERVLGCAFSALQRPFQA